MLHLCDILQLVVDCLNDGSLSGKQPVRHTHDGSLHVAFELRYELDAVNEEALEQFLAIVSFIPDEFSVEEFHKRLVVNQLAVIYISRCNHEVEQFTLLITDQMQLEPEEPAHGTLPLMGNALERLVDVDTLIPAYPERSAVYEADTRILAQQYLLDEQCKGYSHLLLQLDKPVVGYQLGEQMPEMFRHMLQIIMFLATESKGVEQDEDHHSFTVRQTARTVATVFTRFVYQFFFNSRFKYLQNSPRTQIIPIKFAAVIGVDVLM